MIIDSGATNQSIVMRIFDDAGLPVAGLNAAGLPVLKYLIAGANLAVTITPLSDLASATAAHSPGGSWSYGDGTYRFDLPNAVFAAAGRVTIWGEASGKRVAIDPIDVAPPVNTVRVTGTPQTPRDIGGNVDDTISSRSTFAGGAVASVAAAVTTTDSGNISSILTSSSTAATQATAAASSAATAVTQTTAIKAKTDNLPVNPAAVGSQMDLVDAPNATAIGAMVTAIFAGGSIDGYTLAQVLKLIAAAVIGKVAGLPGTSMTLRAVNDSKIRLTMTLDANGNVTAVTADAT